MKRFDSVERAMALARRGHSSQSLDAVAIFKGLPSDALAKIQSRCAWRRYEPRETVVEYLDSSTDVYFIAKGEVRVSIYSVDGKAVTFRDLGRGEMFGKIAAIDGGPRSTSVEARTSCLIASMTAAIFRELLQSEPALAQALLRDFATRVYEFSALAIGSNRKCCVLPVWCLAKAGQPASTRRPPMRKLPVERAPIARR
jgi:CRP/FNR family cyclic AMP-dependent transcriptional regulator